MSNNIKLIYTVVRKLSRMYLGGNVSFLTLFSYIFHTIVGSHAVQWFFAGVSIMAVVFVWLLLPETHGKKLSEIEEYFQNHFLAVGAEAKTKKRRAQRKQQRIDKSATEPLNPKTIQNV